MAEPNFKEIKMSKNPKRPSLMKVIRSKCIECCCGVVKEVNLCTVSNCPLYDYRSGKRPKVTVPADEQSI